MNPVDSLKNKSSLSFICFDVCEFYPSITEKLLSKALDFATNYRWITNHEREIILHTKRSLLFSDNCPWKKKAASNQFDVTMGSFNGATFCHSSQRSMAKTSAGPDTLGFLGCWVFFTLGVIFKWLNHVKILYALIMPSVFGFLYVIEFSFSVLPREKGGGGRVSITVTQVLTISNK